jgi:hypothetical protein
MATLPIIERKRARPLLHPQAQRNKILLSGNLVVPGVTKGTVAGAPGREAGLDHPTGLVGDHRLPQLVCTIPNKCTTNFCPPLASTAASTAASNTLTLTPNRPNTHAFMPSTAAQ